MNNLLLLNNIHNDINEKINSINELNIPLEVSMEINPDLDNEHWILRWTNFEDKRVLGVFIYDDNQLIDKFILRNAPFFIKTRAFFHLDKFKEITLTEIDSFIKLWQEGIEVHNKDKFGILEGK